MLPRSDNDKLWPRKTETKVVFYEEVDTLRYEFRKKKEQQTV